MDTPAPQIQGQIEDIGKVIPRERVPEHVVEQIVSIPVPQTTEETLEVIQLAPKEMGETTEIVKIIPQERVQNRAVQQITDVLRPQIQEEIVEVVRLIPQE